MANKNSRNGLSKHPLYGIWINMKSRCYNPRCIGYKYYGAKGITICKTWLNSFESFYNWAITNGYVMGLSIERDKVYRGYFPSNCRWIPRGEQNLNRTNNFKVTMDGKRLCVHQWAKIYKIGSGTIYNRLTNGWPIKEAITYPVRSKKPILIKHNGVTKSLNDWCKELGLSRETIKKRVKNGWDISVRRRRPKIIKR